MNRQRRPRAFGDDSGFTLVELLVGMVLSTILLGSLLTMVLAARTSAEAGAADHARTEEARLALNRVSRELRQASALVRVINPIGNGYDENRISAVTFTADFNGDGCVDGVAPLPAPEPTPTCLAKDLADPEVVSYCHEPAAVAGNVARLFIIAGTLPSTVTSCSTGQPILAEEVDRFGIEYLSNEYRLDADADGVTSWEELDAGLPPFGNRNGVLDSTVDATTGAQQFELAHITSVVVHLDLDDSDGRTLRTQLALRNST